MKLRKIIKFYAERCRPCATITPVIDEIASEHGCVIEKIDIDDRSMADYIKKYEVRSLPTVVFQAEDGTEEVIVGAHQPETYHNLVNKLLND